MIRCRKCKSFMPDGARFCMDCGAALDKPISKRKQSRRPKGSGSIKYKPDRTLPYAAYLPAVNGKTLYIGSFLTKQEASDALIKEISVRPSTNRADWTVSQFYDAYRNTDAYTGQSIDGRNSMNAAWKYCRSVENLKMRDVMGTKWQGCIDAAANAGKSRSTCEKVRVLISALCKEAMRDNVILQNYAKLCTVKGTEKRAKDIFTDAEIDLIHANDSDDRAKFILILIYTGFRIAELLSVKISDINFDKRYIIGGKKTEAGKNRTIPILPVILPYLRYFADLNAGGTFLLERNGKPLRTEYARKALFYKCLIDLGILTADEISPNGQPRLTPHCTRKTFASLARRAKVEKDVLIRVIGHTNYDMTDEAYVQMQAEFLNAELQAINPAE